MAVMEVLRLGNPKLYEKSEWIKKGDVRHLGRLVRNLHDTLMDFRNRYGAGRAIAAPQIGVMKKLVYMHIGRPVIFLNPILNRKSKQKIEVWDDCMCFPDLLVKVSRHQRCRISYRDKDWKECEMFLEGEPRNSFSMRSITWMGSWPCVGRSINIHSRSGAKRSSDGSVSCGPIRGSACAHAFGGPSDASSALTKALAGVLDSPSCAVCVLGCARQSLSWNQ